MMVYPEHDIDRTRKLLPAVEAAVNVVPAACGESKLPSYSCYSTSKFMNFSVTTILLYAYHG